MSLSDTLVLDEPKLSFLEFCLCRDITQNKKIPKAPSSGTAHCTGTMGERAAAAAAAAGCRPELFILRNATRRGLDRRPSWCIKIIHLPPHYAEGVLCATNLDACMHACLPDWRPSRKPVELLKHMSWCTAQIFHHSTLNVPFQKSLFSIAKSDSRC